MEEVVVNQLTEKLTQMFTQKLFKEVWLVTRFREDFEFICDELDSIKSLLKDARGMNNYNFSSTNNWLGKLEDFLIDAVEIVEECDTPKFQFLSVIFRYRMGRRIRILKERIRKVHTGSKYVKYTTAVLEANVHCAYSEEDNRRKSTVFLSQSDTVGMEHDFEVITQWILEDKYPVIAVVGMGGIGKTLLVQNVFNRQRVRDRFDHLVWLAVSPKFVVRQLLLTTCRQMKIAGRGPASNQDEDQDPRAGSNQDQDLAELKEEEIRDKINKHLEGKNKNLEKKRCLFVLDDVWDKEAWEKIGLQLPSDSKNKIVVTSRDNRVAEAMKAHTHHMEVLSEADSSKLFSIHANFLHSVDSTAEDQRLTIIARSIVHKCAGLPLAIKTIAASMASVRRLPNVWESTLNRLNEADAITDRVMPSLRLSYHSLPDPLKPCFLYCSAFPPNNEVKSEYLAHVWIAEGFVSTSSQEAEDSLYEVARSYIEQLIARYVMESSRAGRDGRVKYCKMHSLLHELALSECHKQTKCLLKPGKELKELPVDECQGVRRISLIKNDIIKMEKPIPCTGLRTLLLCNNFNLESISESFFDNLRYLSVLDLSQTSIHSVPKSIGNLRQLKLLNLSETNIEMLPNSLCGLKRLQFLDVSGCQNLRSLHKGIGRHKFMLHLNVKGCKKLKWLPAGISKLTCLRTLKGAVVFKGDQLEVPNITAFQWRDLKGLTRLQHLLMTVTIDAQSSSSSQGDLEGTFGGMPNMRTLSFQNISSSYSLLHLPKDMECMQRLEIVRLRNCAVPKWMYELSNLLVLVLEGNNSGAEYKGLEKIRNLKKLRLSHNSDCNRFPLEFGEANAFSQLETLIIEDFDSLEAFPWLHDKAMPMLEYLRMKKCKRLQQMPEALQKLTGLEEIEVDGCPIWEEHFWREGNERVSTLTTLYQRRIKLTIDNFTISIERNIKNDDKIKSAMEKFPAIKRDRSKKWPFSR